MLRVICLSKSSGSMGRPSNSTYDPAAPEVAMMKVDLMLPLLVRVMLPMNADVFGGAVMFPNASGALVHEPFIGMVKLTRRVSRRPVAFACMNVQKLPGGCEGGTEIEKLEVKFSPALRRARKLGLIVIMQLGQITAMSPPREVSETPRSLSFPVAAVVRFPTTDRKSTRLNSSHMSISYAVFCLKKKK